MGFFKDFKDDVSQAVNELVDEATGTGTPAKKIIDDDVMVDTLEEPIKQGKSAAASKESAQRKPAADEPQTTVEEPVKEILKETSRAAETARNTETAAASATDATSETAIITPGLKITGDIESSGAIELLGTVIGNVSCRGKLSVSGTIEGNTHSSAFYSNEAQIRGNISCDGAAKIGNGSVVIGDLAATSAVIAGAIKGDIDVHGPVIIDTTAIVMGDIKSEAVQINNGAVIEGHCSQCYSDNSPSKFFKDK